MNLKMKLSLALLAATNVLAIPTLAAPKGYFIEVISANTKLNGRLLQLHNATTAAILPHPYTTHPPIRIATDPVLAPPSPSTAYTLFLAPPANTTTLVAGVGAYQLALVGPFRSNTPIEAVPSNGDVLDCNPRCVRAESWVVEEARKGPAGQGRLEYGDLRSSSRWEVVPGGKWGLGEGEGWIVLRDQGTGAVPSGAVVVQLVLREVSAGGEL